MGAINSTSKVHRVITEAGATRVETVIKHHQVHVSNASAQGASGTDGNTILSGTSNPIDAQGVTGDFFINTATSHIFGPKAGGTWPAGVDLVGSDGEAGVDGNTILSGAIDPTTEGVDGDWYINTVSYDFFGPKATTWPAGVSLIGPAGPGGTTDHLLLTNIGTNSHPTIDTHLASNANPHGVTLAQAGGVRLDEVTDAASLNTVVIFPNSNPTFGDTTVETLVVGPAVLSPVVAIGSGGGQLSFSNADDWFSFNKPLDVGSFIRAAGAFASNDPTEPKFLFEHGLLTNTFKYDVGNARFDLDDDLLIDAVGAQVTIQDENVGVWGNPNAMLRVWGQIYSNAEIAGESGMLTDTIDPITPGATIVIGGTATKVAIAQLATFADSLKCQDLWVNYEGGLGNGNIYFENAGGSGSTDNYIRYTDADDWFEISKGLDGLGFIRSSLGLIVSKHATLPRFQFEHGAFDHNLSYNVGNDRFEFDDDLYVSGDLTAGAITGGVVTANNGVLTDEMDEISAGNGILIDGVRIKDGHIDLFAQTSPPARAEGRVFYDNATKAVTLIPPGSEVWHQLGQELLVYVYNDTVSTLVNGTAVRLGGIVGGYPAVIPASAADTLSIVAMVTEDIEPATYGMATMLGGVNDVDTSSWPLNTQLYLSETAGLVTADIPDSPNYQIVVGTVMVQDAVNGAIYVNSDNRGNLHAINNFFNGAVIENFSTAVTSDGADISLEVTAATDLSLIFGHLITIFNTPASVDLIPGTDTAPVLNYVFIPESTGVLTANTTGFPAAQHVPIATVLTQSAVSAQTDAVYKHHRWRDHLSDANELGHANHINAWIRDQHATWKTGGTPAIDIQSGGTPDDVYFSLTSGTVRQLHVNSFPSKDTETGDYLLMVNDSVTPYVQVSNLNTILTDSTGGSMSGRRFSLVILAAINSDNTVTMLANLPSDTYGNDSDAISDPDSYADYSLPPDFRGTGVLIARVTLRHQVAGGGTWTLVDLEDLRGNLIGTSSGGGGGGGGGSTFTDAAFRIINAADGSKVAALDVSDVTTSTTRTLTVPDADGTIQVNAFNTLTDGSTPVAADGADSITFIDSNGILVTTEDHTTFGPVVNIGLNSSAAVTFGSVTASFIVGTIALSGDTVYEKTPGAGVTVDGLLIKDSGIPEAAVTAHEGAIDHNALDNYVAAEHSTEEAIEIIIDGQGATITTGLLPGEVIAKTAMTITGWVMYADQSGSIAVDVWKDTDANFPPTVADSIVTPSITTAQKNSATGLSIDVAKGDIIRFNVDSVTSHEAVTLALTGVRV